MKGFGSIRELESRLGTAACRLSIYRRQEISRCIRPAAYGWAGRTLLFCSELKALHRHPDFRGEIDRGALGRYLDSIE
jgi:hypothetical protein